MAAILSTSFAAPVTDWAASWSLASVTGVQVGHLCAAESEPVSAGLYDPHRPD